MNRAPFGEKCSCGHFESEHDAEKKHPHFKMRHKITGT